jgi:uncharacterized protein (DUF983 family)
VHLTVVLLLLDLPLEGAARLAVSIAVAISVAIPVSVSVPVTISISVSISISGPVTISVSVAGSVPIVGVLRASRQCKREPQAEADQKCLVVS